MATILYFRLNTSDVRRIQEKGASCYDHEQG